ncbi:hypothetical protein [Thalassolituus marinus]|uniref:Uncharacterized protein n=1 Tax=Thalassolituus marinus TaxID=671053 RepID=A0ABS7ZY38_9GAMM|nr:hypothetical protein [Thalassolituus marinus]MCA6065356.1 hypothetical protein [Thalassolituus marinus]
MKKMLSKIGLTVSLIPLFIYFAHLVFEITLHPIPIALGLISVVLASYASYVWKKLFDESLLFGISNELFEGVRRTSISVGFISSVVVLMFFYLTDSELFDDRYIILVPSVISLSFIIFSSLVCILFWSWEGFSLKRIEKPEMITPEAIPALKEQNNALPSFKLNKSGLLEAKGNDGLTVFYRLLAAAFGVTVLSSVIGYFNTDEEDLMSDKELFNKIVMQAKASIPMSVAPNTTLFDVGTDGVSLIYKYKFSDMDSNDWKKIDKEKVNQQLREKFSDVYCSDKKHFTYLARSKMIRVVLADANEQPFNVITFTFVDCMDLDSLDLDDEFLPIDSFAR